MGRRRRGLMSESFKTELARDLGFYNVVQSSGWEGIRAKDAGNMVKRAIQIAEEHLAKQNQQTMLPQSPVQRRYRP
ncbi:small, acid-soluble spore protein, alpha/beta type [Paenibacillus sp. GP183]|jgi:small acid-soluble spore protein F (minor alpha/beta-type SASP)|uniref:small, acid-soluble spore protein, alpha/beta type n=1 Tax=Paenibacillus sp. GP183 TaxID=1882751 RepID=UPI0008955F83|nr:small, acid-soluble spore protein, alpha/beta type [Paenibacillus sp. GP183]SEC37265.1 small acid-soluble spore protein F (minor alpha/beta-type SASP) [Paenibacillus sp. GP183]